VHYDVARQMCDYLCNFIKNGNPNGKDLNGEPLPEWTPYTSEKENFMEFTTGSAQTRIPASEEMKKYL
jgi:para-nitrobenzyl esterase